MEENKKDLTETPETEETAQASTQEEREEAEKFEEEVKEHFDEVIEKNEKKMGKAAKKKKLKAWQIVLIVIGAIIVAAGIGVGLFFLIGELTYKEYVPVDVELDSARPNVASTFTAEEQQKIDLALANNATEDQVKEAIALIYQKANQNKIGADKAIAIARGNGTASVDINFLGKVVTADGGMAVRGFKVQSGDAFYYQKGAKVVDCSIKGATSIVANILNQQERAYESGTGVYKIVKLKGSDAKVGKNETATLPYFTLGDPKSVTTCADRDEFMEKGYYLDDPRELCNFRINKSTIVLKELAEGEKYIEYDATKKFYKLRFSLLIEGENRGECVGKARQYLRDSSGSENLEFAKYDLQLEVWDNGYAKFMHDDEIWSGEMNMAGTKSTTSSNSWYECTFYYDFDASLFTEEDAAEYQEGDWAKKIIDDYSAALN
ncbi:MAG: hypothetical protein K5753_06850 [Clostridia bacterium]|nr:hypothetical protein [Clostridia bacterium]